MTTYIKRQKIIKVGNSYAVTLDKAFAEECHLGSVHDVSVAYDVGSGVASISPGQIPVSPSVIRDAELDASVHSRISPELQMWTDQFLKKNKQALQELSHA